MRAALLTTLAAASCLAAAPADARPSTYAMSCGQAQGLVSSHGAVVMNTGPHTYKRFVATAGYCSLGEFAYRVSAPTRDTQSCELGYECRTQTPLYPDGFDIPGQ